MIAAIFFFLCASKALVASRETRLFADFTTADLAPREHGECSNESIADCLSEFQTGRFDGSQMHRSLATDNETQAKLRPLQARLLVLVTTVWRNFQRRRLLRQALKWCRNHVDPKEVVWYFLLGEVPTSLLRRATQEVLQNEDMLLLGGPDEFAYQHIGDAYELREPNPEITKLVCAMRRFLGTVDFEYVLVADDDSFVNLPNAMELINMLPKERVYVGNMIDSIPQRWNAKKQRIEAEYTVNLYLSAPSKVPAFAHGMGFLVSRDVVRLMGDFGLNLKSRGNDDMLLGLWFRSVEHLYYLHYWPMFMDHEDFQGAFSRACDVTAVVVHRMNPERWRTFSPYECHVCGPPDQPLDMEDDPIVHQSKPQALVGNAAATETIIKGSAENSCISAEDTICSAWASTLRGEAVAAGEHECLGRCERDIAVRCPPALCHALCVPPGQVVDSGLCPEKPEPPARQRPSRRPRPLRMVVTIFGSPWHSVKMRVLMRTALRSCTNRRLGVRGVRHVFLMGALPGPMDPLRRTAVGEVLHWRDLAVMQPMGDPDAAASAIANSTVSGAFYGYEMAWGIVQERFGGADYVLFADHRAFINIPYVVHAILPKLPPDRVYLGCLMDETLFGLCTGGKSDTRCDYLYRRRAPLFAHGMGFITSGDVARFVYELRARVPLRTADLPADVAFGMWVQPLEDVLYESAHAHIHEWPPNNNVAGVEPIISGPNPVLGVAQQPLSGASTIVFPMTPGRWERHFDPNTCTLVDSIQRVEASTGKPMVQQEMHVSVKEGEMSSLASGQPVSSSTSIDVDCWTGMGGRPQAWYLVCCKMNWQRCWGGQFSAEVCCKHAPSTPEPGSSKQGLQANATAQLDVLRQFLGFSWEELELLLVDLSNTSLTTEQPVAAMSADSHGRSIESTAATPLQRFICLTPRDCTREAFARFYQQTWIKGALPLRHPWITDVQDQLFGLALKLREENDGWGPSGHEHTLERVQLAEWLRVSAQHIQPEDVPGERRCLEWDSAEYSRHFFSKHCQIMDVLTYAGGAPDVVHGSGGQRRYLVDIHIAETVIPPNSTGIVICAQIFEHLRRPHVAMAQLFQLVAPGGFVVWSAPMFSELHGAPDDFFRYTLAGAVAMAEDGGFVVVGTFAPGGLRLLAGYLLGLTAPYWRKEELLLDEGSNWPLQIYMLLQKPITGLKAMVEAHPSGNA